MKILFPLLAVVGPVVLLWLGYLGVAKRRTIGRAQPESQRGMWISGPGAVVLGVIYLAAAPLILYVMLPIAATLSLCKERTAAAVRIQRSRSTTAAS